MMQTTFQEINDFLRSKLPELKQGTSIESLKVIAWVRMCNEQNKTLILGLALEQGVGCSPFCGCAANQIVQLITPELKKNFPELAHFRVHSLATLPPKEIRDNWQEQP